MEIIFNNLLWEGQRAFRLLTCEWKFSSLSSFPPETQGEPAFSHTSMHTWGTFSHKAKQPPPPRYSQVRQFKKKKKAMESGKCKDRASFGGSTVQCYIAWPRNIHRFCNDFSPIGNHFQFQTPDPYFFSVILLTALLSFSSGAIRSLLNSLPCLSPPHMPRDLGPCGFLSASILFGLLMGGAGSLESSPLWKSCQAAVFANGSVQTLQYLCSMYRHWVN